jgi:hypothetical protein
MTKHECEECGKKYKTRSGLWKHKQKCEIINSNVEGVEETSDPDPQLIEEEVVIEREAHDGEDLDPSHPPEEEWLDFSFDVESPSESLPPGLKLVVKQAKTKRKKNLTKAEQKVQADTNIQILKMGLTGIDHISEAYARAVTLNPDYEIRHSDSDKTIVAKAQWEYMKEKGLDAGHYISTGGVALALTGWYVGVPLWKVQKQKKRSMLGKSAGIGRTILSKIPIIGKRFKKKPAPTEAELWEVSEDARE